MSDFSLNNKHILIIGASSGIGFEVAKLCSKLGAKLTLTSRNVEQLKTTINSQGINDSDFVELDVANNEQLVELVNKIEGVDGLVYTPGLVKLYPVQFLNESNMDAVRVPIFDGAVFLMANLIRKKKIRAKASIVFISSISSGFPYKGGAIYTSSKAALETYSKTLALELSPKGIRSNCIKAGLVKTKILEETIENVDEDILKNHANKYPLGIGEPIDVANAIVFLLSDASKWITGTEIILDGGLTAGV